MYTQLLINETMITRWQINYFNFFRIDAVYTASTFSLRVYKEYGRESLPSIQRDASIAAVVCVVGEKKRSSEILMKRVTRQVGIVANYELNSLSTLPLVGSFYGYFINGEQ